MLTLQTSSSKYKISKFYSMLRGSMMFIPDPGSKFFHPWSQIPIKGFKYFLPKTWFLALGNMIRDVHSGSRIPNPDPDFFPSQIPAPNLESRGRKSFGSATLIFFHSNAFLGPVSYSTSRLLSSTSKPCIFVLGSILDRSTLFVSWSTPCKDDFLCCSDF